MVVPMLAPTAVTYSTNGRAASAFCADISSGRVDPVADGRADPGTNGGAVPGVVARALLAPAVVPLPESRCLLRVCPVPLPVPTAASANGHAASCADGRATSDAKGHAASCADGRATSDTRGPSGATGATSNANGRAASYAGCRATSRVGGFAVSCDRPRSQRPLLGRRRVPLPASCPRTALEGDGHAAARVVADSFCNTSPADD